MSHPIKVVGGSHQLILLGDRSHRGAKQLHILKPTIMKQSVTADTKRPRHSTELEDTQPLDKKPLLDGADRDTDIGVANTNIGVVNEKVDSDEATQSTSSPLVLLTERQEMILAKHLARYQLGVKSDPRAARLYRKLKVRQRKRDLGKDLLNVDCYVQQCVETVEHYVSVKGSIEPVLRQTDSKTCISKLVPVPEHPSVTSLSRAHAILNRLSLQHIPILLPSNRAHRPIFTTTAPPNTITSPFTARVLKPIIFESYEFSCPKTLTLSAICKMKGRDYNVQRVTFRYFHKSHLQSLNAFVSYFFWSVDLLEYLQYPDFTVVAHYGKMVIGCGFMTPDVKVSEAYIPFLLVHPDFQRCGIGKIMLYHLIQSCQGKDVTLHVSVDNTAMLLYQQFGFKVEQFCVDFYDKYYAPGYHLSKHAFLMRLRR